jgi:hypothetical protein
VKRKLRLSLVLPIVQVAITAILLVWASQVDWILIGDGFRAPPRFLRLQLFIIDMSLIWRGANAPTFPFCAVGGNPGRWPIGQVVGGLLYLIAVAILWHLVGRFLDRFRGVEIFKRRPTTAFNRIAMALVLAWGLFLLGLSVLSIQHMLRFIPTASRLDNILFQLRFRPEDLIIDVLFVLWSLALVILPAARLARRTP